MTNIDVVRIGVHHEANCGRSTGGKVVDTKSHGGTISGRGLANGGVDGGKVRVMTGPDCRCVEEISKGRIRHRGGHGDKIILSADAGAQVNKTILFEVSA